MRRLQSHLGLEVEQQIKQSIWIFIGFTSLNWSLNNNKPLEASVYRDWFELYQFKSI